MKSIITFSFYCFFLLHALTPLAQTNISFDMSYSPSVLTFRGNKPSGIDGFYVSKGAEINLYAQVNGRLKLGTGFGYRIFEADAKGTDNLFVKDVKYHFGFKRIEMPFHAKYNFYQKPKLKSYVRTSIGFVSHRLSHKSVAARLLDGTKLSGIGIMNIPLNYFLQIGIGQQWVVTQSFVLMIEPYWGILKNDFEILSEHPVKYHQFGVKLGVGFESFGL